MALMRYYADTQTIASIASRNSASFNHNLPGVPDFCYIQFEVASASNPNWVGGVVNQYDATGVTIFNSGDIATGNLLATTMLFHSIIQ